MLIRRSSLRLTHPSGEDRRTMSTCAMLLLSCQRKMKLHTWELQEKWNTSMQSCYYWNREEERGEGGVTPGTGPLICLPVHIVGLHHWYPGRIREATRSRACGSITQRRCVVCVTSVRSNRRGVTVPLLSLSVGFPCKFLIISYEKANDSWAPVKGKRKF